MLQGLATRFSHGAGRMLQGLLRDCRRRLVHEKLEMNMSSSGTVVVDVFGPNGALYHHENGRGRVLQLQHHQRTEVTDLVAVREEVAREPVERMVRYRSDILLVRIGLAVAVEPDHVELRAVVLRVPSTLVLPYTLYIRLQSPGHGGVVADLQNGVGLRHPAEHAVHLQHHARLTKVISAFSLL